MDKLVAFKRFSINPENKTTELKTIFSGDEKLLHNYKSIKIAIESHAFTLIPNRLFNLADRETYLNKSSRIAKEHFIKDDQITFNQSRLIYAWNSEVISVLKNYFPSGQMFHSVTSLLNGWRKQSEVKEGKKIYIDIESNFFTIAFFDEAQLIFINRFNYQTAGDFLYYTLMTYDRFELKPENTPCIISGHVMEKSEIYKKLYTYIRNLQFLPPIPYYDFSDGFNIESNHYYFNLYSLKLCES